MWIKIIFIYILLKKVMRGFFKLSFKQLMLANIFLGSRKENFYAFMRPFILGYRTSFCILNLFYTLSLSIFIIYSNRN